MYHSLVSIIIPTYNSKNLIKETIESALNQSYKNIEIILVDDGSTDGTIDFFDEFKKQGIQCYRTKNGGASKARNYGLSKAKGDFIQFLDADDILHKDKITLQVNKMIKENSDISFTTWGHFIENVNNHSSFKFEKTNYCKVGTGKELMISFGMDNWFMPVFSWLTKKELIKKAGIWNVNITNNDDGEYFTRVLFNAKKVICIDEILAYYRVLPTNSLSKLNSINKIDSAFESYKLIISTLKRDTKKELLSYPKRLLYTQFISIRRNYPKLALRAAKEFDKLDVGFYLMKKRKLWFLIKLFGLNSGVLIYENLKKIKRKINFIIKKN